MELFLWQYLSTGNRFSAAAVVKRRKGARVMHSIPIWILDSSAQRFIAANDAATRLFGYSSEELRTLTIVDLLDAAEHERFRRFSALARDYWGDGGSWLCRSKSGISFRAAIRFHGVVQGGDMALFMFTTAVSGHPSFRQPEAYRATQAG
jgi:PAS domain S-box-containing protein